jgi:hypothetical protein
MLFLAALAACTSAPPAKPPASHLDGAPPFMRQGYTPYSRDAAVAVAMREWKAWGAPVHDEPPGSLPPPREEDKLERQEGYWQRVGEYWWTTLGPTRPEAGWTGRHAAGGMGFPASRDGDYAWSAAFIRYVLYSAGAGTRLPPGLAHSTFIRAARDTPQSVRMRAHALAAYAPQPGDLVCYGRASARPMQLNSLPDNFPAHCDIVVATTAGSIAVIGGNVADAVSLKNVPTDERGRLGDGTRAYDTRYPWFTVIQVDYER